MSEKSRVLCSTGAFIGRPNGRDYRLIKEFVPRLECDGIEFMMYSTWYPIVDTLIADLKSYGLTIPVVHCQKSIGEKLAGMETISEGQVDTDRIFSKEEDEAVFAEGIRQFADNVKIASKLGASKMVIHLWNGIVSDKNIEKNIERFEVLWKMADSEGIDLLVENVLCNQQNPMAHWKALHEAYPQVHFIFDTKMAAFHNQTEDIFLPEWNWLFEENRIRHMHINDYGGGYMDWSNLKVLPIGAGHIDFDSFMGKFLKTGYEGDYTMEATALGRDGVVDFEMLNRNFASLRELLNTESESKNG